MVGLGKGGDEVAKAAERIYESLAALGVEAILDDRDAGPGQKLTDAELLGCPLRLTVGKRTLAEGQVEAQVRRGAEDSRVEVGEAAERAAALLAELG